MFSNFRMVGGPMAMNPQITTADALCYVARSRFVEFQDLQQACTGTTAEVGVRFGRASRGTHPFGMTRKNMPSPFSHPRIF